MKLLISFEGISLYWVKHMKKASIRIDYHQPAFQALLKSEEMKPGRALESVVAGEKT
jgi:hypothetical protein